MLTATTNIIAIGQAATKLGTTTPRLAALASTLGIKAAMRINGVDYLAADDVERIREHLAQPEREGSQA